MSAKSCSVNLSLDIRPLSDKNSRTKSGKRPVPAFSIESLQKNTYVVGPPKAQKCLY